MNYLIENLNLFLSFYKDLYKNNTTILKRLDLLTEISNEYTSIALPIVYNDLIMNMLMMNFQYAHMRYNNFQNKFFQSKSIEDKAKIVKTVKNISRESSNESLKTLINTYYASNMYFQNYFDFIKKSLFLLKDIYTDPKTFDLAFKQESCEGFFNVFKKLLPTIKIKELENMDITMQDKYTEYSLKRGKILNQSKIFLEEVNKILKVFNKLGDIPPQKAFPFGPDTLLEFIEFMKNLSNYNFLLRIKTHKNLNALILNKLDTPTNNINIKDFKLHRFKKMLTYYNNSEGILEDLGVF
jgi:hypothetical protein